MTVLNAHISYTLYKNIIDIGGKGLMPHRNEAKYSSKVFHLESIPMTNSMYWKFFIILATKKTPDFFPL